MEEIRSCFKWESVYLCTFLTYMVRQNYFLHHHHDKYWRIILYFMVDTYSSFYMVPFDAIARYEFKVGQWRLRLEQKQKFLMDVVKWNNFHITYFLISINIILGNIKYANEFNQLTNLFFFQKQEIIRLLSFFRDSLIAWGVLMAFYSNCCFLLVRHWKF